MCDFANVFVFLLINEDFCDMIDVQDMIDLCHIPYGMCELKLSCKMMTERETMCGTS